MNINPAMSRRPFAALRLAIRSFLLGACLFLAVGSVSRAQSGSVPIIPATNQNIQLFIDTWNSFVSQVPGMKTISTAQGQQLVSAWNSGGFDAYFAEIIRLGLFDFGSSVGQTSTDQVALNTIQSSIFEKAEPGIVSIQKAKDEKAGAAPQLTTVFSTDVFYNQTEFDGGGKLKTYGTNLALLYGGKVQFRATMPIYKSTFAGSDTTTYGIDLNSKYKISENFAVGGHTNFLRNQSDGGDSNSWTGGVYCAGRALASETSSLTFGVLLDYNKPQSSDGSWVGALGANYGIKVGNNTALNPYGIAYRNFDAKKTWYDVGIEVQQNFTATWAVKLGVKTTLALDGVDQSYQVYLGSAWKF
jgi:hypothetical protein